MPRINSPVQALLFITLWLCFGAYAETYKCTQGVKTVYQDHPAPECQAMGIVTGSTPQSRLNAYMQAQANADSYRQMHQDNDRQLLNELQTRNDALDWKTARIQRQNDWIRADTKRIIADTGKVHNPPWPTRPIPVQLVNPHVIFYKNK